MNSFRVIDKLAFLVHEPFMYDHWIEIWKKLNLEDFVILLSGQFRNIKNEEFAEKTLRFITLVKNHGFQIEYLDDVLRSKEKYTFIITNHTVAGNSMKSRMPFKKVIKNLINRACAPLINYTPFNTGSHSQYISLQCGITPIRIMYGADINDGWSLSQWNEQYNYILCHGPNDENAVRSRFSAQTYQIGYPRYDKYFNEPIDRRQNPLAGEFSLSSEKQTVVWLPTLGEGACSISSYAKHISALSRDYNVIVRPHPLTVRNDPQQIKLLEQLDLKIDRNDLRVMNHLYSLADYVVCDYGGTSFSALYLDKKIILLNVQGADTSYASFNSSNMELRKLMDPVINPEDGDSLLATIQDNTIWDRQSQQRKKAFKKYFASYQGTSAHRACQVLQEIREGRHAA